MVQFSIPCVFIFSYTYIYISQFPVNHSLMILQRAYFAAFRNVGPLSVLWLVVVTVPSDVYPCIRV